MELSSRAVKGQAIELSDLDLELLAAWRDGLTIPEWSCRHLAFRTKAGVDYGWDDLKPRIWGLETAGLLEVDMHPTAGTYRIRLTEAGLAVLDEQSAVKEGER